MGLAKARVATVEVTSVQVANQGDLVVSQGDLVTNQDDLVVSQDDLVVNQDDLVANQDGLVANRDDRRRPRGGSWCLSRHAHARHYPRSCRYPTQSVRRYPTPSVHHRPTPGDLSLPSCVERACPCVMRANRIAGWRASCVPWGWCPLSTNVGHSASTSDGPDPLTSAGSYPASRANLPPSMCACYRPSKRSPSKDACP